MEEGIQIRLMSGESAAVDAAVDLLRGSGLVCPPGKQTTSEALASGPTGSSPRRIPAETDQRIRCQGKPMLPFFFGNLHRSVAFQR